MIANITQSSQILHDYCEYYKYYTIIAIITQLSRILQILQELPYNYKKYNLFNIVDASVSLLYAVFLRYVIISNTHKISNIFLNICNQPPILSIISKLFSFFI